MTEWRNEQCYTNMSKEGKVNVEDDYKFIIRYAQSDHAYGKSNWCSELRFQLMPSSISHCEKYVDEKENLQNSKILGTTKYLRSGQRKKGKPRSMIGNDQKGRESTRKGETAKFEIVNSIKNIRNKTREEKSQSFTIGSLLTLGNVVLEKHKITNTVSGATTY
jgi:hypothetical protein